MGLFFPAVRGYASGVTARLAPLLLLLVFGACRRDPLFSDLDRAETALMLTPAQKPAWNAFRREAEAAEAGARRDWREVVGAERFDEDRARAAADRTRAAADRLIAAWKTVDDSLTPSQRAAVRRVSTP